MHLIILYSFAGAVAGGVTGILGTGGGLILIPLLSLINKDLSERIFSFSVAVMLPVCVTSALTGGITLPLNTVLPYLLGSALGGIAAARLSKTLPVYLLRRVFGIFLLWGGVRLLCL